MFDLALVIAKYLFLAMLYLFIYWAFRVLLAAAHADEKSAGAPALQVTVVGKDTSRMVKLTETTSIGRANDNGIRLDDDSVSSHHARLVRRGSIWLIEDLGSRNGTFVNGERVSGRQALGPESDLRIGRTELKLGKQGRL